MDVESTAEADGDGSQLAATSVEEKKKSRGRESGGGDSGGGDSGGGDDFPPSESLSDRGNGVDHIRSVGRRPDEVGTVRR